VEQGLAVHVNDIKQAGRNSVRPRVCLLIHTMFDQAAGNAWGNGHAMIEWTGEITRAKLLFRHAPGGNRFGKLGRVAPGMAGSILRGLD
jgi:hypothetical protein